MFNQKILLGFALAFAALAAAFLYVPDSGSSQDLQNPLENKAAEAFEHSPTNTPGEGLKDSRLAEAQAINRENAPKDPKPRTPITPEDLQTEAIQRTAAANRFDALPANEKYQQRLTSLTKLIKSEPLKLDNQVALTRTPLKRRDLIEAQKTAAERELNVNGMTIDIAQRPKIAENR